jgi:hypothetical protein
MQEEKLLQMSDDPENDEDNKQPGYVHENKLSISGNR